MSRRSGTLVERALCDSSSGRSRGRITVWAQVSLSGSARRQSREQPCPKKGGLPTSRGAEDAERRSARETGNQLGDHTLAAEEETGVAGVEGREPFERADPAICLRRRLSLTVDGLKAGNVLGELGLGRPQLAPAHRRPLSRLLDEGRSRRVDERTAGRKPVVGPLREGSAHHGIKAGEADQRRSVLVCMGEEHGSPSCPLEGGMPGQALVEHTAEGVEIGATIDGLTRHLLGGGVRDGAGEVRPVIPPVLVGSAGEAEVGEVAMLAVPFPGDQNIPGLHVAVHEAPHMARIERGSDLGDEPDCPRCIQRGFSLEQRSEVGSFHEAHGDVQASVRLSCRIDRDHIRVVETGGELGFPQEAVPEARVAASFGVSSFSATGRLSRRSSAR